MGKTMAGGGDDGRDWRSPQTPQIRRTLVLRHAIDSLLPIGRQLENFKWGNENNEVSTIFSREKESEASAWPATYRR
jgi:hypothetical protein